MGKKVSHKSSIENCPICRHSRKNKCYMGGKNNDHIFGYIGPASKNKLRNSKVNISSSKKHDKKVKKSSSRHIKTCESKEYGQKMKCPKWLQPGKFFENITTCKNDKSKTRYDESDTDFDPRRNKINKNKQGNKQSSKRRNEYSSVECCLSDDSIAKLKNKRKAHRTDSEDCEPLHLFHKCNDKKEKKPKRNEVIVIASNFSINSTKKLDRRHNMNTSKDSMKMKNLKSAVTDLFGSIESFKGKKYNTRYNVSPPIDAEDRDPKVIKNCLKTKKPATLFTNSNFSINSRDECAKKKKKRVIKDTSDSSMNLNLTSKIKRGTYGSIESMKHYKKSKKTSSIDKEDETYDNKINPFSQLRSKPNKRKTRSNKKKKENCLKMIMNIKSKSK